MARKIKTELKNNTPRPPAMDPENRENQLIAEAYNLVEQRLLDGTATSQETVHFLKLGSKKKKLEEDYIRSQIELNDAKIRALKSSEHAEEMYLNALKAMKEYTGLSVNQDE